MLRIFLLLFSVTCFAGTPPPPPVTIQTFGSSPNLGGAVVSHQQITLEPADLTHPGGISVGTQSFGGQKTFGGTVLIQDGTNQFLFTITTQGNVTVHTGDVYTDTSPYGTGHFTVVTGVTNGTSFTCTGDRQPESFFEGWTRSSGSGTLNFQIINYVDNITPPFGFAGEPQSGWVRFGSNYWGLVLNGQTIMSVGTATFNGITGNTMSIGKAGVFPADPDSIFNANSFYPNISKHTFINWDFGDGGVGSEIEVCNGNGELTCTLMENYFSNTEYVPYLNGVGMFSTGQFVKGMLINNMNNDYTVTLSSPASIVAGTKYSNGGVTYTVITTTSSSSTVIIEGPQFPTSSSPPAASGTLTYVSGPTTGNQTYTSFSPNGYIAFDMGGRYSNNEVGRITSSLWSIPISFQASTFNFTGQTSSGLILPASYNVQIEDGAFPALDIKLISGSPQQMTYGMNTTASGSPGTFIQAQSSIAGNLITNFQNMNQTGSGSASTLLTTTNTVSSTSYVCGLQDAGGGTQTYYGGKGVFYCDANTTATIFASLNSSGYLSFNAGGLTSGTERMRITAFAILSENSTPFQAYNGSTSQAGFGFANDALSGLALTGVGNPTIVTNGNIGIDIKAVSGSTMSIGLGVAAPGTAQNHFESFTNYNGVSNFLVYNYSNAVGGVGTQLLLESGPSAYQAGLTNKAGGNTGTCYTCGTTSLWADSQSPSIIINPQNSSGLVSINTGAAAASNNQRMIIDTAKVQLENSTYLDVNSSRIQNVTDPTGAQDAMTKNYADNHYVSSTTTQSANKIFGGPSSGSAAAPTFRSLVGADLPNPSSSTLGGVESISVVSNNFLTGISTSGVPTQAQPSFSNISGTVAANQLPNPTSSTLGGVESISLVTHNFLTSISTSGVPAQAQPACGDLSNAATSCSTDTTNASNITSGNLPPAQLPNGLINWSIFDDFVGGCWQPNECTGDTGWENFGLDGSSGLTGYIVGGTPAGYAGRIGIIEFTTGTANSTAGAAIIDKKSAQTWPGQTSSTTMTWSLQTPAALAVNGGVDYIIEMGFGSYSSGYKQVSNGCVIQYNRANSTNWSAYSSNAGTQSAITTSDSADFAVSAATWYNFKIVMASGSCTFYVAPSPNGTYVQLGQATTHLPDSTHAGNPFLTIYKVNNSTATATKMQLDWVKLDYTFSSAR